MSRQPTQKFYDMSEIIKYGKKHKGRCIAWVIVHDYKYAQWALEEGVIEFSPGVAHLVGACRSPKAEQFIVPCACEKGVYCVDQELFGAPFTLECNACGHNVLCEDLVEIRERQLQEQELL